MVLKILNCELYQTKFQDELEKHLINNIHNPAFVLATPKFINGLEKELIAQTRYEKHGMNVFSFCGVPIVKCSKTGLINKKMIHFVSQLELDIFINILKRMD